MVSIIIPAYNCELTVESCIKSALNQTYKEIEVVLIDDGSNDRTLEIVKEIQQLDDRLIIISRENRGIAYTRNEGIQKAKGEYICFLDSDDWMYPEMISRLLTGADLSICCYEIETIKKELLSSELSTVMVEERLRYSAKELGALMSQETRLLYPLWNKMFRADLVRKYGLTFPLISCWEDACFVCRYLAVSRSATIINEPLYHYVFDENKESLSKKRFIPNRKEQYFSIYQEFAKTAEVCDASERVFHENNLRLMRNIIGDLAFNIPDNLSLKEQKQYITELKGYLKCRHILLKQISCSEMTDIVSKIGYLIFWRCPDGMAPIGYTLLSRLYQLLNKLRGRL